MSRSVDTINQLLEIIRDELNVVHVNIGKYHLGSPIDADIEFIYSKEHGLEMEMDGKPYYNPQLLERYCATLQKHKSPF